MENSSGFRKGKKQLKYSQLIEEMPFEDYGLNNTVYQAHGEAKFYGDLFVPNLLKWLLSLPGLLCNPMLVYLTYVEKNLHGPCNLLLAIGALFDFLYLLGYSVPFFLSLFAINFIPLFGCFFVQLIPLVSLFASVNTVFFVGLDRLLNILMPYGYNQINQFWYLSLDMCINLAYAGYAISYAVPGVWSHPNWAIGCAQSEMLAFVRNTDLSRNGLYINGASLVCYILVWFLIWRFNKNATMHGGQDEQRHRIFRSVLMIMFLVVFCWFFNTLYTTLLAPLLTAPFFVSSVAPAVGLLTVIVASTSNPPILYICSKEYRRAFQRLLLKIPLLKKGFKKLFKNTANNTSGLVLAKSVVQQQQQQQQVGDSTRGAVHPVSGYLGTSKMYPCQ